MDYFPCKHKQAKMNNDKRSVSSKKLQLLQKNVL